MVYNFFQIIHSFLKTGAESYYKKHLEYVSIFIYYIIPLNYWLTGHSENFQIRPCYFQERLSLRYNNIAYSWSYCLCFIYLSSKITNFQNDLFFKGHSWVWRFCILVSILSIIVISYSHIWNKIPISVWQNIKNMFFK